MEIGNIGHILIYDNKNLAYIEANLIEVQAENHFMDYRNPFDGNLEYIPIRKEYKFVTVNDINSETVKLDETLMKRIAKYNKGIEIKQLDDEIEDKRKQIQELDNIIKDKDKRVKALKDFVAKLYTIDLDELEDEDYEEDWED